MNSPSLPRWITIQEAADQLSVSTKTIRRMIARGALPARRIGERMIRIDATALDSVGLVLTVSATD